MTTSNELRPLLVRVEEAARLLGVSRAKTYQLIREGRLPSVTIDSSRRVLMADLERWVGEQRQAGG